MDQNMNLGNSSPERPSIFINYLDPAPPVAAEQSFLDISIKDEPLDIIDNEPNEDSTDDAHSRNDIEKDDSSVHNDSVCVETLTNADSIYEGIMQCDSDTDFSDVDCQDSDDQPTPVREGPFQDSLLLDDITFSCSICSFTTDKQVRLKDHERNHRKTNLPIFQCIYCSQRYTRNLLYLHVLNVHPGQKFQIRDVVPNEAATPSHNCSRCSYSTKYRENLTLHMKKHYFKIGNAIEKPPVHDKTRPLFNGTQADFVATEKSPVVDQVLQCSFCEFSTSDQTAYTLHKKIHFQPVEGKDATGRSSVGCKICSYSCQSIHSMNEHFDSHVRNRPIKQCVNCDFKSTPIALTWHLKKCLKKLKSVNNADGSPKRIRTNQVLGKSSKDIVTVKTLLQCKTCAFSTKDKLKFKLHVNKHFYEPVKRESASGPTMYHCKMCSYFCNKLSGTIGHINSHKLNLPIIKCTNCDFKSTPRALKFHQRKCKPGNVKDVSDEVQTSVKSSDSNKASSVARFQCSTCTFSTTVESKLKRHTNKHAFEPVKRIDASGRVIYHCKMCSYGSNKLTAVLNHINLHKHNLPIIKCTNCDFKSTSRAIKFHQRNCKLGNVSHEVQNSIKCSDSNESSSTTHFQCQTCTFSTSDEAKFKLHTKKHLLEPEILTESAGVKIYKCRMCSYFSTKVTQILVHINTHRNNLPIVGCSYCEFQSTSRAVKFHQRYCKRNTGSVTRGTIKDVQTDQHTSDSDNISSKAKFQCSTCTFSTTDQLKLKTHTNQHRFEPDIITDSSGFKVYQCRMCSLSTKKSHAIINHINSHKNNFPIVSCSYCDFKSTGRAVMFHLRSCRLKSPTKENVPKKVRIDKNLIKSSRSRKVSSKTLFKCSICTFSSTEKLRLNIHMNNHRFEPEVSESSSPNIHQCEICSYSTTKSDRIDSHLKTHDNNSLVKCSNCDFKSTSRAVKFHMRLSCRATPTPYSAFLTDTKYVSVSRDKHGRKVYQCKWCSYETKYASYITVHTNSHKKNVPVVSCPNCKYKSTRNALRFHLLKCRADKSVMGKNCASNYRFACPTCSFSAPLKRKLKLHIEKNHLGTENKSISENLPTSVENPAGTSASLPTNLKCNVCLFTTTTIYGYNNHMRTHADKVFKCKLCSYIGSKKASYTFHMATHAKNQPIKKCHSCNFRGTPRLLLRHVFTEKHDNKYKCKVCSVVCPNAPKLKRHMTSHQLTTQLKKCPDCSFTSTGSDLLQHNCGKDQPKNGKKDAINNDDSKDVSSKEINQTVETGKTSDSSLKKSLFRCAECSFVTCLRIKLNFHTKKYHHKLMRKRSTKSETINKCEDCSYFTTNVGNLRRHVQTQHVRPKRPTIKKCRKCDFRSTIYELRMHSRNCKGDRIEENTTSLSKGPESSDGAANNQSDPVKVGRNDPTIEATADISLGLRTGTYNSIEEDPSDISASTSQRLECRLCSFTTFHKGSFKLHVEVIHSRQLTNQNMFEEIFECRICDFTTLFKTKMADHRENTKHNTTTVLETNTSSLPDEESADDSSKFCSSSKKRDDQNNISMILDQGVYKCTSCAFSTVYKYNWNRHVDAHVENTVESGTDRSDAKSTTKQSIYKNMSDQTNRSNRENESKIAEAKQNQVNPNDTDEDVVFMKSPGMYACYLCSYTSKNAASVRVHQNETHLQNTPIRQCPNLNCSYSSTPKALSLHLLKCPDSNESDAELTATSTKDLEVYKCALCSYTSTVKGALTRHFRTHDIKRQPVKQCAKCDFKGTPRLLENHGPTCPNKDKPKSLFKCSECSYSSYSAKLVNNHEAKIHQKKEIKTNTGPKSFKCEFCSFTSFWQYLIERHMDSHTLLKLPIEQCTKCDFRSTPSALTAHMNTCTKKTSVLSDVSANNDQNKKLKHQISSDLECSSENDSDTVSNHADQKKVQDNEYDQCSEMELDSSDDELKRKSPRSSENLSSNIDANVNGQEEDEVQIGKECEVVNILAMPSYSPSKTAFNCPKCSFSTLLRIKLKVHIEKTHTNH